MKRGLWSCHYHSSKRGPVLTKFPIFEVLWGWQSSQNVLLLSQSSQNSSRVRTKRDLQKSWSPKKISRGSIPCPENYSASGQDWGVSNVRSSAMGRQNRKWKIYKQVVIGRNHFLLTWMRLKRIQLWRWIFFS